MTEDRALGTVPSASQLDRVVLVDEFGAAVATMSKLMAHARPGLWHRAFSACVLDDRGRLLLQQRSWSKYHFAGRWSNTCCGHPRPGESLIEAVQRRLFGELGLELAWAQPLSKFRYQAFDPASGLYESEEDRVLFVGVKDVRNMSPSKDEVADTAWMGLAEVQRWCDENPDDATPWLPQVLSILQEQHHA